MAKKKSMKDMGELEVEITIGDMGGMPKPMLMMETEDYEDDDREGMAEGGMAKSKTAARNSATLDATSNRASNRGVCRGGGAALRGIKFRGVK
jgi:hypothetical protein